MSDDNNNRRGPKGRGSFSGGGKGSRPPARTGATGKKPYGKPGPRDRGDGGPRGAGYKAKPGGEGRSDGRSVGERKPYRERSPSSDGSDQSPRGERSGFRSSDKGREGSRGFGDRPRYQDRQDRSEGRPARREGSDSNRPRNDRRPTGPGGRGGSGFSQRPEGRSDRPYSDRPRPERRSPRDGADRPKGRGGFGDRERPREGSRKDVVPVPAALRARDAVAEALEAVCDKGLTLDAALNAPSWTRLSPRDRAFARRIVSTALRQMGKIEAGLKAVLARPLPPEATRANALLRCGIAELFLLDGDDYAVVDSLVGLSGRVDGGRYQALTNAVLRNALREEKTVQAAIDAADAWPEWLMKSWQRHYGEEKARAIAHASAQEPALDLTAKGDPAALAQRLGGEIVLGGSVRLSGGDPRALEGFDAGDWWVQDAAAAVPARLLGRIEGKRVLDLCAAPGGKTLQLASLRADVTAVDRSAKRLKRLHENLERCGLTADVIEANALVWTPAEPFDAVLADLPCSATGTLRRQPDVASNKGAQDIDKLVRLQTEILKRLAEFAAPEAPVVICTCSLQPEEGEELLKALPAELEIVPILPAEIPGLEAGLTPEGALRLTPDMEPGMDGFFIARLVRI